MARESKKKSKSTRKSAKQRAANPRYRAVSIKVEKLEVARGHDGFLRGTPEPVVLLAAYVAVDGVLACVHRSVEEFLAVEQIPTNVSPRKKAHPKLRVPRDGWLAVVGVALEVDSGKSVAEVFARLEKTGTLLLFSSETAVPAPEPVDVFAQKHASAPPQQVHLLFDGANAEHLVRNDDWVAATFIALPHDHERGTRMRLPFRSSDGRNEWTLVMAVG